MPSEGWTDAVWEDPDGGTVVLHGTMPTVVYPNAMRPRITWHGLALLESPDVVDLWVQEEADEAESQGVNMTHALLSGGAFGKYIEGISTLENLQGGAFPTRSHAASSASLTATHGRCTSSSPWPMTTTGVTT